MHMRLWNTSTPVWCANNLISVLASLHLSVPFVSFHWYINIFSIHPPPAHTETSKNNPQTCNNNLLNKQCGWEHRFFIKYYNRCVKKLKTFLRALPYIFWEKNIKCYWRIESTIASESKQYISLFISPIKSANIEKVHHAEYKRRQRFLRMR